MIIQTTLPALHWINKAALWCSALLFASALFCLSPAYAQSSHTSSVAQQDFIDLMAQLANQQNKIISAQRHQLLQDHLKYQLHHTLPKRPRQWVNKLARTYQLPQMDLSQEADWVELIKRVDTIPPSLIIAQAAIESNWGRSRFAKEGYNFFGIWCYSQGCGIVPKQREKGKTFMVKSYPNISSSLLDYYHTLNTNVHYKKFRELRYAYYLSGKPITGVLLSQSLTLYSTQGSQYTLLVEKIINGYHLEQYNS